MQITVYTTLDKGKTLSLSLFTLTTSYPSRGKRIKSKNSRKLLPKNSKLKIWGNRHAVWESNFHERKKKFTLNQKGYITELLNQFGMINANPVSNPIDTNVKMIKEEKESNDKESKPPFRELVGALMYLAVATRPDIAHAVSALSQFNSSFGQTHWTAAKHVLRYLKGTMNLGLTYRLSKSQLEGFVDADWASCLADRKSYMGYVFTLNGGAISWNSCKQRTVALSSTEVEYMGLSEITKEAIYLRGFLLELGFRGPETVNISNDNMGALKLSENPVYHARSKHIDGRHHFVRDSLKSGLMKLNYLPTEVMVADVLTRGLPAHKHRSCVKLLKLEEI